jgi:hypothetical protein
MNLNDGDSNNRMNSSTMHRPQSGVKKNSKVILPEPVDDIEEYMYV